MENQTKITEEELTFVLRKFVSNSEWDNRTAFRRAIQECRGAISMEAEICITHAFLDSF